MLKEELAEFEANKNNIKFTIEGEGNREDLKTYDITEATRELNARIKASHNVPEEYKGTYNKTWITLNIPGANKPLKFRYDLNYLYETTDNILKFIIAAEKKELKYFKNHINNFVWIKDKDKYIKQQEELFIILEKFIDPVNPEDPTPGKQKNKKNNFNSISGDNKGLEKVPTPETNIIEFNPSKTVQAATSKTQSEIKINNKLTHEQENTISKMFIEDAADTPIKENKNNIISFGNIKNKKNNIYSFDAVTTPDKSNSKNKIKMCVCGSILKTDKEKQMNFCSCCLDYVYTLYETRQLPQELLREIDQHMEHEKQKAYNKALDELKSDFNSN